jgi:hypothetical protein
VAECSSKLDG